MPSIDRNSSVPYYRQVYSQIAEGIENGLYPAGKKLPSIRECASELGVSNTTIELAYQKLSSEGYINARRGSGYTICKLDTTPTNPIERFESAYQAELEQLKHADSNRSNGEKPRYDFAYDSIDRSLFPFSTWARLSREVFFAKGAEEACLYNDSQGLYALRQQIAQYVGREHGVACIPEQIFIMPTTRDLITAITGLFDAGKTHCAMENPGYDEVAKRLLSQGFDVSWIPSFPHPEWDDVQKAIAGAKLVYVTPSCQFPANQPMPREFRNNLVRWANDNDAYLIDDEYGWEYLMGVARMPSLGVIDRSGHVITTGSFSNSLSPAISLSYAILPPKLMLRWQKEHRNSHPQVPWQTQAAMATFISDGHWRAHIRKARTSMSRKRKVLLDAIRTYMGDSIEIKASPSSLFALVQTLDGRTEDELVYSARDKGVAVYPTSRYWNGDAPDNWRYVLVGFSAIPEEDIEPGVRALAEAWNLTGQA